MAQSKKAVYVLASGGTGGHMFPAVTLAKELNQHQRKVYLFTDQRCERYAALDCFNKVFICNIFRNNGPLGRVALYLSVLWHVVRCCFILLRVKPSVVVGFGGYTSIPPVLAAQILGIPTIIHEQNALLGRANRLLAKRAYRVATSFPVTEKLTQVFSVTGNPVRPEILALYEKPYCASKADEVFTLLVFGGSQGAAIFSDIVPRALASLPIELQKRLKVYQQCRSEYLSQTKTLYRESSIQVEIDSFFSNMSELYEKSHLVIARAGASTIAELTVAGKPAILVPYAASLEGDQHYNAQPLSEANAALVIDEKEFTVENLKNHLISMMTDSQLLEQSAIQMRQQAHPQAGRSLMNVVAQVIGDLLTVKT